MVALIVDEQVFLPKWRELQKPVKEILRDYIVRICHEPDDPDNDWKERVPYRASQFTQGWVLDWEVIRHETDRIIDLKSGAPRAVKVWDIRELETTSEWQAPGWTAVDL